MAGALCKQERTELIDIHSRFRATLDTLAALRGQLAQACSKSHSAAPAALCRHSAVRVISRRRLSWEKLLLDEEKQSERRKMCDERLAKKRAGVQKRPRLLSSR
jgi:hypothetical protein